MFAAGRDTCLTLFGALYDAGQLVFPAGASILEVGCAEADWMTPLLALRPDVQLHGIDWRPCDRPGTVIRGDVLTQDYPDASFDAAVGISSIEHIGLGHYDDDPLDPMGDHHCMERLVRWVKPGGLVYLDVPYGPAFEVCGTSHRVYDHVEIARRLVVKGLTEERRWYFRQAVPETPEERAPDDDTGMVYVALRLRRELD